MRGTNAAQPPSVADLDDHEVDTKTIYLMAQPNQGKGMVRPGGNRVLIGKDEELKFGPGTIHQSYMREESIDPPTIREKRDTHRKRYDSFKVP